MKSQLTWRQQCASLFSEMPFDNTVSLVSAERDGQCTIARCVARFARFLFDITKTANEAAAILPSQNMSYRVVTIDGLTAFWVDELHNDINVKQHSCWFDTSSEEAVGVEVLIEVTPESTMIACGKGHGSSAFREPSVARDIWTNILKRFILLAPA